MKVVCPPAQIQSRHAPAQEFSRGALHPYPESPKRYDAILSALEKTTWADFTASESHTDAHLEAVHGRQYIDFLRTVHETWSAAGGEGDLVSSLFAGKDGRAPANPAAAVGYYGFDTTPIMAGTWAATRAAADACLTAADLLLKGATAAYAVCRPPGHHAASDRFGGYCYLNHAAIATQHLAAAGPVAIIDIDYHHGNGTQQIFYTRNDVLYISIHADTDWEYPLFWGRADETGEGEGAGSNLNLPLPAGTDDRAYLLCLDSALAKINDFQASHLVISAGFDTWMHDPLGTFRLTFEGINAVGAKLAEFDLPTLIVQEGGYDIDNLGRLATEFLQPFSGKD
jgi:acetoin utilization deacetylase AcuC-like enzyme